MVVISESRVSNHLFTWPLIGKKISFKAKLTKECAVEHKTVRCAKENSGRRISFVGKYMNFRSFSP